MTWLWARDPLSPLVPGAQSCKPRLLTPAPGHSRPEGLELGKDGGLLFNPDGHTGSWTQGGWFLS